MIPIPKRIVCLSFFFIIFHPMLSKLSLLLNARLTSSDVSLLCLKSILRLTNALFKATLSSIVPIAPFSIQIALINDFLGFLGSLLRIVGKDCSSSLKISLVVGTNHLLYFDWFPHAVTCFIFSIALLILSNFFPIYQAQTQIGIAVANQILM